MDNVIRTRFETLGKYPEPGYEWSAGIYPQQVGRLGGRVTARLTRSAWEVVHVIFRKPEANLVQVLAERFPLGEDGERAAKAYATNIFKSMNGG